jgi:hypothetical protein
MASTVGSPAHALFRNRPSRFRQSTRAAYGYAPMVSAFRQGLKETSYVDGQNVSSLAGRAGNTTECRRWWLSWFVVRWL